MANKRFWLGMLAIALTLGLTVAGCGGSGGDSGKNHDDDPNNDPNDPNNPNSDNYKSEWLLSGRKEYKVTDGVASPDYEYKLTYTSYTDDKHYSLQWGYTQQINTTTSTYTQVGSNKVSSNESMNGNTLEFTQRSEVNRTDTYTNGTTQTNLFDYTTTINNVYDAESGLPLSLIVQSMHVTNGTTVNTNNENRYNVELLSTDGNVKTYKQTVTESKVNGESRDVDSSYYSVYKIQNGSLLEENIYYPNSALQTTTLTFPDNPTIKKKLPKFTFSSSSIRTDYTSYGTCEVVSDSDKELRIRIKQYSNGVLTYQYEQTFEPRKR
jgi:hypothetical protein